MEQGKVKWFDSQKGYGFIKPAKGGRDLFVHHSGIEMEGFRTLSEGDLVEYETEDTPKGLQAIHVRKIK